MHWCILPEAAPALALNGLIMVKKTVQSYADLCGGLSRKNDLQEYVIKIAFYIFFCGTSPMFFVFVVMM
ncbi:hypothetical protein [Serratia fonticola]|uniref:hypothetical protein n=1 Tax=Serratia fonticola TaxID=47917 RepID=UPI003BB59B31